MRRSFVNAAERKRDREFGHGLREIDVELEHIDTNGPLERGRFNDHIAGASARSRVRSRHAECRGVCHREGGDVASVASRIAVETDLVRIVGVEARDHDGDRVATKLRSVVRRDRDERVDGGFSAYVGCPPRSEQCPRSEERVHYGWKR